MSDTTRAAFAAYRAAAAAAPQPPRVPFCVPPTPPAAPTRQGQREIVAATLAVGMIAAEGKAVTAAEAVARLREVLEVLEAVGWGQRCEGVKFVARARIK